MTLPLSGMTVLDVSRLLPGPMCSMHLRDMGARVIKIEDTHGGDYARFLGMPKGFVSPVFHILNRGKESISLDLSTVEGREVFLKLVAQADVVLESFRPGVMKKLGLDYETLQRINPQLVMCSLSGYGQTGPWAERAGHDMNYCATAGILDQCGEANGAPTLSNFQIADLAGGTLSAAMAILGGLVGRLRHAKGCYLDVSMTDCAFANNVIPLAAMNLFGQARPRGEDMLTGERPCYCLYQTSDQKFMAVGALEEKFWVQVCEILKQPEWKARYFDQGEKAQQLKREVAAVFAGQTQQYWRACFAEVDCCVTPILTPEEAFDHPQLLAREMIHGFTTPQQQTIRCPASAVKFTSSKIPIENAAPQQGEHTQIILQQLHYKDDEINRLQTQGVIRQAPIE